LRSEPRSNGRWKEAVVAGGNGGVAGLLGAAGERKRENEFVADVEPERGGHKAASDGVALRVERWGM